MKLTGKEMTILSVFLSIVIIAVGLFLFIMPAYESIEPNRQKLDAAKAERDQIYESLAREATIDQEIQDAIEQANTLSLSFYDDLTTYEADVIVREILDATNMSTNSLMLSSYTTATLTVTDYIETVVSYPLKEYAGYAASAAGIENSDVQYDENGNIIIPDEFTEDDLESALKNYLIALLSTQTQTIGSITVNFTVSGTRGDFLKFLDYIADLERATIINSANVSYTAAAAADTNNNDNNGGAAEGEGEGAEDEAPANTAANTNNEPQQLTDSSQITSNISLTFYCITPMSDQVGEEAPAATEPEAAE